jgi:hypothetical protein
MRVTGQNDDVWFWVLYILIYRNAWGPDSIVGLTVKIIEDGPRT